MSTGNYRLDQFTGTIPAGERKASVVLAFTIPIACALVSIAWAIVTYLMVREKQRAQVEMARLEIEGKKQASLYNATSSQHPIS